MKNRLVPILLIALFVVPMLAAVLLQSSWLDWQPEPERAHGTLLMPVVALGGFEATDAAGNVRSERDLHGRWWLVRVIDGQCDPDCRQRLDLLHRVRLAQDRHVADIGMLLLASSSLDAELRSRIVEFGPAWMLFEGAAATDLRARFPEAADGATFIIDPEGNIMERFEPGADATGIRKDLRRLLTWTLRE
ncbi:MAG: SCO family protein [Wenzhouxiangellaceae bacterium]